MENVSYRGKFKKPTKGVFFLYHLRLEQGFEYIGISKNWRYRIKSHFNGKGAILTRKYKPLEIKGVWNIGDLSYQEAEKIEDAYVLRAFKKAKKAKVRGGHFLDEKISRRHSLYRKQYNAKFLKSLKQIDIDSVKEFQRELRKKKFRQYAKEYKTLGRNLHLYDISYEDSCCRLFEYWCRKGIDNDGYREAMEIVLKNGWFKSGNEFLSQCQKILYYLEREGGFSLWKSVFKRSNS